MKGVPLLRQAVVALLLPHVAGAARPRAQAPGGDGRSRRPLLPRRPPPAALPGPTRHGNTDVRARRPIGSRRRRGRRAGEAQEGAGAAGSPARREGREGGARGGASHPPRTPGHPFHTARFKFWSPHHTHTQPPKPRTRARRPGTRSPDPPLKRPLREAPVPVRAAVPPLVRARAPARPQAPRGPRHVTAPSQGGSGGRASIGKRWQRQREQLRCQRGAGGVEVWRRRERRTGTGERPPPPRLLGRSPRVTRCRREPCPELAVAP